MDEKEREEIKTEMKEAFQEWMEMKWSSFGKWIGTKLLFAAFCGLVYLAFKGKGLGW